MASPPTYRPSVPTAPTAALKKAPDDCVNTGSVAVVGRGLIRAGMGRLVPSPTAMPAGRKYMPLSQNISGPIAALSGLFDTEEEAVADSINGEIVDVMLAERVLEVDWE